MHDGKVVGVSCAMISESPDKSRPKASSISPQQERVAKEIAEYFSSQRQVFSLSLELKGTEFQKRVWSEMRKIPFGQTRSYGDIARRIGSPRAARAVGMACNKNPCLLLVPCHRVVAANGRLGGFALGIAKKKKLLELEGRGR